ncbi:hypothetical protein KVR01_011702 [Diaporthe batatas]|uniref:uncharacterized protein n=1 Tax=Diaporthe batatas TaxID=748121 RepID=UPI001D05484B|nr:uncharacterized protein KVR01_011702 [Diaporthe batatas]KAG8158580.1 hypothetical protein KVR01_011702 [Diaporthe batatas]
MSSIMNIFLQGQHFTHSVLAEVIAKHGLEEGINTAAIRHNITGSLNPPTSVELLKRVRAVKPEHINQYHQDLPNALALRLLAPNPGLEHEFEPQHTTKKDGSRAYKYKCLAPGCNYVGSNNVRHMDEMHVRNINNFLCCPYEGCNTKIYRTRGPQFKSHCESHETKNDKLLLKGRAIVPLSSFQ